MWSWNHPKGFGGRLVKTLYLGKRLPILNKNVNRDSHYGSLRFLESHWQSALKYVGFLGNYGNARLVAYPCLRGRNPDIGLYRFNASKPNLVKRQVFRPPISEKGMVFYLPKELRDSLVILQFNLLASVIIIIGNNRSLDQCFIKIVYFGQYWVDIRKKPCYKDEEKQVLVTYH